MKYTVFLSRQAERSYKKLEGDIRNQVKEKLILLQNEPRSGKTLHGDLKNDFSLRVGKTRIIYTILEKEKTVYVIAIGHRNTVYE